MKIFANIVIFLSLILSTVSNAQEKVLKVGIYETAPFVMKNANGEYSGFDIDLWHAIANDLNLKSNFVEVNSFPDLIDSVKQNKIDAALSSITVNSERHNTIDFSTPYFNSGLMIMVRENETETFFSSVWGFFSQDLPKAISVSSGYLFSTVLIMMALFVLAYYIHVLITKYKPYWSYNVNSVTFWIFATIATFLFSVITAKLSSTMTADHFTYQISSPKSLRGKSVATVAGTTSVPFLNSYGANITAVVDINDAYDMLKAGQIDAVVYDAPTLQYYANTNGSGSVAVVGAMFANQPYGIALPKNSDLRRAIDGSILKLKENGIYDTIYNRYFGNE